MWQILRRGGLPLGSPIVGEALPAADELAAAVHAAVATEPSGRARDALCAFVLAWRRFWPHPFARVFGESAQRVTAWADERVTDTNRDLKLSRIAAAHLAHVL